MTTLLSQQLRTLTGFHFTHEPKHRLELFLLTVCAKILYWFPIFSNYARSMITIRNFRLHWASESAMNTMHCLTRIRLAFVLRKIHFTFDDKFHFCGICIVMCTKMTFSDCPLRYCKKAWPRNVVPHSHSIFSS